VIETPLLNSVFARELSPKRWWTACQGFFEKLNSPQKTTDSTLPDRPLKIGKLLIALEIGIALLCGLGCISLGLGGGAWILGGIIAGAIALSSYRLFRQATLQPNRDARKVGQILVGLTIGLSMHQSSFLELSLHLPMLLAIAIFLLVNAGVIGYLYRHLEKTDQLTALLATVPGNIGVMASIAADYRCNTALVSLVQLIRFTSIILFVPLIAKLPSTHNLQTAIAELVDLPIPITPGYFVLVGLFLCLATLAAIVGIRFKIPVAAFICPIIVGLIISWTLSSSSWSGQETFTLPPSLKAIGQILLGITIGEYWAVNPRLSKATILRSCLPVAMTIVVSLITAAITQSLTHWDWLTCLLVTAPGGSPEMIWIALAFNHNVEIVTAGHLVRLLTINLTLPLLITLVINRETRLAGRSLSQDANNRPEQC